MPNFVDAIAKTATEKGPRLRSILMEEHSLEEAALNRSFQDGVHWHPLPGTKLELSAAFAVDGGLQTCELSTGATLMIAQSLLIGESVEDALVDVEVLRGTIRQSTRYRYADLFRQSLEVKLAASYMGQLASRGVMYLDGALYGGLPQLYPMENADLTDPTLSLIQDYQTLFSAASRDRLLVSIAKSSRVSILGDLLQDQLPERSVIFIVCYDPLSVALVPAQPLIQRLFVDLSRTQIESV